jgi:4Fe-4S ferredoxin
MKRYKKEQDGILEVGHVLYTKRFKLTLDRNLCKGCQLCKLICPREAVSLLPAEDVDGKAVAPTVDIDENICDFHGICAVICPFSAIKISINGDEELPAVKMNVFPTLIRDIEVDSQRCKQGCKECETACPIDIVTVNEAAGKPDVNIQKELCAGCRICQVECPSGAVEVSKFIEGNIGIDSKNCPEGCKRCLDVCPVDALELGEDKKVFAKEMFCIYCGACVEVCPEEDALSVERTAILHTPIDSGAWHKGLELVTSAKAMMRELAAEKTDKIRKAVANLQ